MTRPKKIVWIVIIILAIILLAYVLFFDSRVIQNKKVPTRNYPTNPNSKYEIPISLSPMSIEEAEASSVLSQWPTYRNEKFGFSIKYPPGWGVTNEEFPGDVWFISFRQSPHDFVFGISIDRNSLAVKTALESTDGSIPFVYTNRGYSFGFRIDEAFANLVLPTLRFF